MKKFFQKKEIRKQLKNMSIDDLINNQIIQPLNSFEMNCLKGGEGGDQGQDDSDIDLPKTNN